jgi:hypothetical protein
MIRAKEGDLLMIPVGKLVSSTNSLFPSGNFAWTFLQKTGILKEGFSFPGDFSIIETACYYKSVGL